MKKLAIIAIAIIMVLSMVATALVLAYTPDVSSNSTTDVVTTVSTGGANENNESILLVDRSGSTKGMTVTGSDYGDVVNFSSGLGVVGGYSEIAEAMYEVLEAGYNRIGIVTDCEETHKDGSTNWDALNGYYENVEILIYLTEVYEDDDIQDCILAVSRVINPNNCTFKIFKADGTMYHVGCENFNNQDYSPVATTEFHTESTEGNKVPLSLVIILLEVGFLVFCIMAILLLALCECKGKTGTTPVGTAINSSDSVLLDGSGSVANEYKSMTGFCRREGKTSVIRFGGQSVSEMSIDEAEMAKADGATPGYEAMKFAYAKGHKTVTILTDGEFGDDESLANGVCFDEIFFVVPANCSKQNIQHLKKFGRKCRVIAL